MTLRLSLQYRRVPLYLAMIVFLLSWASTRAVAQSENDTLDYSEDFDDGEAEGWWLDPGWDIVPSENGMAIRGDGQGHSHIGYTETAWTDSLLRCRIRLEGDFAHVSYRHDGEDRYYFGISEDAVILNKQIGSDTFMDSLATGPGVSLGVWHVLEIDGTGGSITVRIDDGDVLTYDDSDPLTSGGISFESFEAEFWLDDIEVYIPESLAAPEPPAELSWVRTGGPLGGLGYDIRMRPNNTDHMYVTDAFAGTFRSFDGGESWEPANNGVTTRAGLSGDAIPIFCLTIDPNNSDIIWIGTSGVRGIYKSIDAGDTWVQMDNGIVEESGITFRGFTVDPASSDIVYAAAEISSWIWSDEAISGREFDMTQGVVYKTTDGGANWEEAWRGDNLARYVWIDPGDSDVLYVSTGIFDREAANSDPSSTKTSASAGGVGIIKSIDGGETWEEINNGLGNLYVGSLFMHPEDSNILIAGTGNNQYYEQAGVYHSKDGGTSWEQTLSDDNINAVEFFVSDPDIAYAGSAGAIYRSEDTGATWEMVAGGGADGWGAPGVRAGFPIDFQVDPEDPDRIFVNNYGGGNFLSTDGGRSWEVASSGYTGAQVRDVAVDPSAPGRVFAAARSGIFVSLDGGEEWEGRSFSPAVSLEWYVVAIDPSDSQHILAANNWDTAILESFSGGRAWQATSTMLSEGMGWRAITFAPSDLSTVYAGSSAYFSAGTFDNQMTASGIYVSNDGGATWTDANSANSSDANVTAIAIHPEDSQLVYAATGNHGVLKTENGGQTWYKFNEGLPENPVALSIVVNPDNPAIVFVGLEGAGLYRSEDSADTWEQSVIGMSPQASVSDIVIDPTDLVLQR